jgi:hypothetical protein
MGKGESVSASTSHLTYTESRPKVSIAAFPHIYALLGDFAGFLIFPYLYTHLGDLLTFFLTLNRAHLVVCRARMYVFGCQGTGKAKPDCLNVGIL